MLTRAMALFVTLTSACGHETAVADGAAEHRPGAHPAPAAHASTRALQTVRIHHIQGRSHLSPLRGQRVTEVQGVVTWVARNGFVMQDPAPDGDEATSEALFVFTRERPPVKLGDHVAVSGRVSEYRPGCAECAPGSSAYANLTSTQLDAGPSVRVLAHHAELPPPVVLGASGRAAPPSVDQQGPGNVESPHAEFAPARDAVDFYESLEHMRVVVRDPIVVGPTRVFSNGDRAAVVLPEGGRGAARGPRGTASRRTGREHPERVFVDSRALPALDVGDRFTGALTGTLGYSFGSYKLYPDGTLPPVTRGQVERERHTLGAPSEHDLSLATLNVENLDPADPPAKFATLAEAIVARLGAPDLVSVEEIQDDSGPRNDGKVDASTTFSRLISAITSAGGPAYQAHWINPEDGRDGGQPGGNIRVGLLVRTDRGLALAAHGDANFATRSEVGNTPEGPTLRPNPGRIAPEHPAFRRSRKPLVAELSWRGERLFVVACHFSSKSGDQPLFGRFQPPARPSDEQRRAQAQVVAAFVGRILALDSAARIVVLGDLNDFEDAETLAPLRGAGLTPLVERLPADERYSYVFNGIAQTLDHMFVSPTLLSVLRGYDIVHINAEFAVQASDHDPVLARFRLPRAPR